MLLHVTIASAPETVRIVINNPQAAATQIAFEAILEIWTHKMLIAVAMNCIQIASNQYNRYSDTIILHSLYILLDT